MSYFLEIDWERLSRRYGSKILDMKNFSNVSVDKEDPTKINIVFSPPPVAEYIVITFEISNKKCECGSEKVGSNKHSGWCPLYG